jgi:hypothetical protein
MTREKLRRLVRDRAAHRCEYCHLPDFHPVGEPFHMEHVRAKQHGGDNNPENLAWACHRCNFCKGPNLTGIDPKTEKVVSLFHPRADKWEEHFVLRGAELRGRTPKGRATVELLQMNSPRRLERRAELIRSGWF